MWRDDSFLPGVSCNSLVNVFLNDVAHTLFYRNMCVFSFLEATVVEGRRSTARKANTRREAKRWKRRGRGGNPVRAAARRREMIRKRRESRNSGDWLKVSSLPARDRDKWSMVSSLAAIMRWFTSHWWKLFYWNCTQESIFRSKSTVCTSPPLHLENEIMA